MEKKKLNNHTNKSEEFYQCGFIAHVQNATLVIGTVGTLITFSILLMLIGIESKPEHVVFTGIVLCCYSLLILGYASKSPNFYLPFLFTNPICVGLAVTASVYPSLIFLSGPAYIDDFYIYGNNLLLINLARLLSILELFSALIAILLSGYFESIVFRAYCYQRKQNNLAVIIDELPTHFNY